MEYYFLSILIATVLQFALGAIWYSAFFGKLWGRIHGFDNLSKEIQQKMMKEMGPYYLVQFIVTLVTTTVFFILIVILPSDWNVFVMAGLFWLGFVLPAQVSAAIFGGTESKWLVKKIAVQAGAAFLCLQVAAAVLTFF
jgi:hypothetical protein